MNAEIPADATRRKCLLFAAAVLRADFPLVEAIVRWSTQRAGGREQALSRELSGLPDGFDAVERVADGTADEDDAAYFRETWLRVKEAAVMDQDFHVAVYFRDTQDLLATADPEFPRRVPHYVRAARAVSSRGLILIEDLASHYAGAKWKREEREAVEDRPVRLDALRADVFGPSPLPTVFAPLWRTDTAVTLARTMYDAREFSAMPILADALQDAGCDSDDVLAHCRDASQVHVRGCWVIDGVLGRG